MFSYCAKNGMKDLYQTWYGHVFPSKAFEEGGIHEAIADYEDAVFFDILAGGACPPGYAPRGHDPEDFTELTNRMDEYITEFEENGIDNLTIDI